MDTTTSLDCSTRKNALREQVWQAVEPFVDGPKPLQGRIPNFKGAKEAARNLTKTKEFRNAKVIKVHPSLNATSFREYVLRSGKTLLVPPLPGHDFLYFRVDSSSVRNENINSGVYWKNPGIALMFSFLANLYQLLIFSLS